MKPVIGVNSCCVIVPSPTGVVYFNQTGGYAVHDLEVEGYIILFGDKFYLKKKDGDTRGVPSSVWDKCSRQEYFDKLFAPLEGGSKYNGHGYDGIDEESAIYIEKAFSENDFINLVVDRDLLPDCEEARVHVHLTIKQYDDKQNEVAPLKVRGVLTWENSD